MILRKVAHNVFDTFVGNGWNNWRRVFLKGTRDNLSVVPTDKGSVTLSDQQLTTIKQKFTKGK